MHREPRRTSASASRGVKRGGSATEADRGRGQPPKKEKGPAPQRDGAEPIHGELSIHVPKCTDPSGTTPPFGAWRRCRQFGHTRGGRNRSDDRESVTDGAGLERLR